MNYPYWGMALVFRTANGWIVSKWVGPHEPTCYTEQYVFGDLQWDACQDFIKAVTTERPAPNVSASNP